MPENFLMNAIDGLVGSDMRNRGVCPGNLSFWNPGEEYKAYMSERLSVPMEKELYDYIYSYSLNLTKPFLRRLGAGGQAEAEVTFTVSSTLSIVQVVNLLRFCGVRRVCILAPSYFSVRNCLRAFGLAYEVVPLVRDDSGWHVPVARIREGAFDALWVTSPIYGTGEVLSDEVLADILRLRDDCNGTVVFDESLALSGLELARRVDVDDASVFIYSPHKAISVNSHKFSAMVYHRRYSEFFNSWSDVFGGSLPRSCVGAVYHYLSNNYHEVCVPAYRDFIRRREAEFAAVLETFPWAHAAPSGSGHYRTVFTDIPMPDDARAVEIIERVRTKTGSFFYPSTVTGFSRDIGLAFRVNLLQELSCVRDGLRSVLSALAGMRGSIR